MFKKYGFILGLGLLNGLQAQTNCTPQEAGNTIGNTGCVSLTYRNQPVTLKTVRAADGNEWLQQNLGSTAVATSIADESARGDYFQWGRWDDGHQLKNSQMTDVYPTPNNPAGLGNGTEMFYILGGSPWGGNYTGWFANPDQNDTWTARTIAGVTDHNGMDPCAALGDNWEIPTEADWDTVMQRESIFPRPAGATNNGITRAFESNLKIPGAGSRKDDSFAFEGLRAYLWTKSASTNPNFYRYVYLGTAASSTTGFGGDAKSHGYSVRCVNKSNNSLGIQNASRSKLNIAPNPVQDKFSIYSAEKVKSIEVYSISGQKVLETKTIQDVDVSSLSKGIYVLKINFEGGSTQIQKLIKM